VYWRVYIFSHAKHEPPPEGELQSYAMQRRSSGDSIIVTTERQSLTTRALQGQCL